MIERLIYNTIASNYIGLNTEMHNPKPNMIFKRNPEMHIFNIGVFLVLECEYKLLIKNVYVFLSPQV